MSVSTKINSHEILEIAASAKLNSRKIEIFCGRVSTTKISSHENFFQSTSASAHVHTRRDTPFLPPVRSCTRFGWPPSLQQLCTYLINDPFLNQKTYKDCEYRIHWNINIRKNQFLCKKINDSVGWNKHSAFVKKRKTFEKKNSYILARIVSVDTAGLLLLTCRILEPYPSKVITFDLSHVISH